MSIGIDGRRGADSSAAAIAARDEQLPLIAAALAGNDEAFRRLSEPHRPALRVYCYRMLGSLHDAEDVVQETMLRAWHKLGSFEGRASFRTWLYRIACRVCLDALAVRRRRMLPSAFGPPTALPEGDPAPPVTEGVWLEPVPDAVLDAAEAAAPAIEGPDARYLTRESVELAFVAVVQTLPPRQRAALVLRDVLGWTAAEVAAALETSAASVNSLLQRGRDTVRRTYTPTARETLRVLDGAAQAAVVRRYVEAWERADVDALAALLTADARMTMPPTPTWYDGRAAIRRFFAGRIFGGRQPFSICLVPLAGANRQPAVAAYVQGPDGAYHALAIKVFTVRAGGIAEITGFCDPALFPAFGLPETLISYVAGGAP